MYSRTTTYTNRNRNDEIIVAIVTNNLTKLKSLLNQENVNNIIDTKNNYTALHYAVTLPNNIITNLILELGADPNTKQSDGYDSFELSLRSGKKFIFSYFQQKQEIKIDNLEIENIRMTTIIDELKKTNNYLCETMDDYNERINKLNEVVEIKEKENNKLKRDLEEADKAFVNLLKKQKK